VAHRGFAVTVLGGLCGAGLAAVAGTRTWATGEGDAAGLSVSAAVTGADAEPLVAALALVALASWGAVLVLRGVSRRVVSALGLLASLGALVAVVLGFTETQDDAAAALSQAGATGDVLVTRLTSWYYLAGAGAALSGLAFAVAVRRAAGWPTMGSRYDAPRPTRAPDHDPWRALDEGRDPTA
jgi:uncharacterized membrane protein (TIGR02234 family)